MNTQTKYNSEVSVIPYIDSLIHLKSYQCWDDLTMRECRDILETILLTNEIVDMDDCLANLSNEEFRSVLYYFMISQKDPTYKERINPYLHSIIASLLKFIEADVNYYIENTYASIYGQHPDDVEYERLGE